MTGSLLKRDEVHFTKPLW